MSSELRPHTPNDMNPTNFPINGHTIPILQSKSASLDQIQHKSSQHPPPLHHHSHTITPQYQSKPNKLTSNSNAFPPISSQLPQSVHASSSTNQRHPIQSPQQSQGHSTQSTQQGMPSLGSLHQQHPFPSTGSNPRQGMDSILQTQPTLGAATPALPQLYGAPQPSIKQQVSPLFPTSAFPQPQHQSYAPTTMMSTQASNPPTTPGSHSGTPTMNGGGLGSFQQRSQPSSSKPFVLTQHSKRTPASPHPQPLRHASSATSGDAPGPQPFPHHETVTVTSSSSSSLGLGGAVKLIPLSPQQLNGHAQLSNHLSEMPSLQSSSASPGPSSSVYHSVIPPPALAPTSGPPPLPQPSLLRSTAATAGTQQLLSSMSSSASNASGKHAIPSSQHSSLQFPLATAAAGKGSGNHSGSSAFSAVGMIRPPSSQLQTNPILPRPHGQSHTPSSHASSSKLLPEGGFPTSHSFNTNDLLSSRPIYPRNHRSSMLSVPPQLSGTSMTHTHSASGMMMGVAPAGLGPNMGTNMGTSMATGELHAHSLAPVVSNGNGVGATQTPPVTPNKTHLSTSNRHIASVGSTSTINGSVPVGAPIGMHHNINANHPVNVVQGVPPPPSRQPRSSIHAQSMQFRRYSTCSLTSSYSNTSSQSSTSVTTPLGGGLVNSLSFGGAPGGHYLTSAASPTTFSGNHSPLVANHAGRSHMHVTQSHFHNSPPPPQTHAEGEAAASAYDANTGYASGTSGIPYDNDIPQADQFQAIPNTSTHRGGMDDLSNSDSKSCSDQDDGNEDNDRDGDGDGRDATHFSSSQSVPVDAGLNQSLDHLHLHPHHHHHSHLDGGAHNHSYGQLGYQDHAVAPSFMLSSNITTIQEHPSIDMQPIGQMQIQSPPSVHSSLHGSLHGSMHGSHQSNHVGGGVSGAADIKPYPQQKRHSELRPYSGHNRSIQRRSVISTTSISHGSFIPPNHPHHSPAGHHPSSVATGMINTLIQPSHMAEASGPPVPSLITPFQPRPSLGATTTSFGHGNASVGERRIGKPVFAQHDISLSASSSYYPHSNVTQNTGFSQPLSHAYPSGNLHHLAAHIDQLSLYPHLPSSDSQDPTSLSPSPSPAALGGNSIYRTDNHDERGNLTSSSSVSMSMMAAARPLPPRPFEAVFPLSMPKKKSPAPAPVPLPPSQQHHHHSNHHPHDHAHTHDLSQRRTPSPHNETDSDQSIHPASTSGSVNYDKQIQHNLTHLFSTKGTSNSGSSSDVPAEISPLSMTIPEILESSVPTTRRALSLAKAQADKPHSLPMARRKKALKVAPDGRRLDRRISSRRLRGATRKMGCSCSKSRCLKRYCVCFQARQPCTERCKCSSDCLNTNTPEAEELRQAQIAKTLQKDASAFVADENTITCNCVNSSCLKNYCVCFAHGLACLPTCRCTDCRNNQDHNFVQRTDTPIPPSTVQTRYGSGAAAGDGNDNGFDESSFPSSSSSLYSGSGTAAAGTLHRRSTRNSSKVDITSSLYSSL